MQDRKRQNWESVDHFTCVLRGSHDKRKEAEEIKQQQDRERQGINGRINDLSIRNETIIGDFVTTEDDVYKCRRSLEIAGEVVDYKMKENRVNIIRNVIVNTVTRMPISLGNTRIVSDLVKALSKGYFGGYFIGRGPIRETSYFNSFYSFFKNTISPFDKHFFIEPSYNGSDEAFENELISKTETALKTVSK